MHTQQSLNRLHIKRGALLPVGTNCAGMAIMLALAVALSWLWNYKAPLWCFFGAFIVASLVAAFIAILGHFFNDEPDETGEASSIVLKSFGVGELITVLLPLLAHGFLTIDAWLLGSSIFILVTAKVSWLALRSWNRAEFEWVDLTANRW